MKKAIKLLFTAVSAAAGFSLAAFPASQAEEGRAAAIGQLMQAWQSRIVAFSLPVDDAKNWSRRNLAKFSRLNAERLALAQRAGTLEELELALLEAPIPAGTHLDVLMANKPGDIAMMGAHAMAKSSPASAPSAYAGLVFTAVTTCRILDSRASQGGTGSWTAGSSNLVKIGPYATGYATGLGAQGGSATSCGLDALAGPGQVAAVLAAVSTVTQAGAGYLTFFPNGAPNPGTTSVSQWYQPGYVQTSFVLIPTDLAGTVAASGFTSATTEVIIDVVGYFSAEAAEGTVTAITAGTGLTGATITTAGTIAIAVAYQLPQACTNGQVAQSNGTGAWGCVTPGASGGTVTAVGASAPLASSGGNTPNISLTGTVPVANGGTGQTGLAANGVVFGQGAAAVGTAIGAAGDVLVGTAGAPAWTGSPSISGSLTLVNPSTASAGNILKGGNPFIHNFGVANTFLGEGAGNFTMSGGSNTATGYLALATNSTGTSNTASGPDALGHNTSGSSNTGSGSGVLFSNTTGGNNTASGVSALNTNTGGNGNTATGVNALYYNAGGSGNTAIGISALQNTTGSNNIALGIQAGLNQTTGSSNIAIGNPGVAAELQTIRIGDVNQTRTFIAGIRGITTGSATGIAVLIDANGQLGTVSSSRRFKEDISDMVAASSALMKLRPVTFHYKTDRNASVRTLQYGLIAEEVAEVYPGLIAHSTDGQVETVMYQFLPPMLLNEYQKQQRRIDAQATEIITQRQVIAELQRDQQALRNAMAEMGTMMDQLRRTNDITAWFPGR